MQPKQLISEPDSLNAPFGHVSPTPMIDLLISGGHTGGTHWEHIEASGEF